MNMEPWTKASSDVKGTTDSTFDIVETIQQVNKALVLAELQYLFVYEET